MVFKNSSVALSIGVIRIFSKLTGQALLSLRCHNCCCYCGFHPLILALLPHDSCGKIVFRVLCVCRVLCTELEFPSPGGLAAIFRFSTLAIMPDDFYSIHWRDSWIKASVCEVSLDITNYVKIQS